MPASGVTVPDGITYALPPPAKGGEMDADGPTTAIDRPPEPPEPPAADSGSTEPAFLSSVVPASDTDVTRATWPGVVTVAVGEPVRGWLNSLYWNITVSTRCTIVFSTLLAMVPFCTSVCSAVP